MLRIVQNIHVETACDGLSQVHCFCELRTYPKTSESMRNTNDACAIYFYEYHQFTNRIEALRIHEK